MNPPNPAPFPQNLTPSPTPCESVWHTLNDTQRAHVRQVLGHLCWQMVQQLSDPPITVTPTQLAFPFPEVSRDRH
jgi:hypothetical protein